MTDHQPGDLSYLFVVTYGRSGSTTLQAILNSIPGFLIRGENRQVLTSLHQFHRTLVRERRNFRAQQERRGTPVGGMTPSDPFYGIDGYPVETALAELRQLVTSTLLRPEADTRVTGFKEIRWYQADVDEFVDWLRDVFPGARFLINTRRKEDVAASGWWADDPQALPKLDRMEAGFTRLLENLGPAAHHVHYDDYAGRPEALEPLFAWLGENFDAERLAQVMSKRHSY
ncbi:sulfotransferase [Serinicoccus chungangensis]|uniref:sulfotransferase n=1 Tax=Serinicoccus chungangensis TaxID=767452 RepID=UPI001305312D|nr:sulfotransferase [Serinicoccus chungangensis]